MADAFAGLWTGPGHDGLVDFPIGELMIYFVVMAVLSAALSATAMYKHDTVEHAMEKGFEKLGRFVGRHPAKVAFGAFVFAVLASGGMPMQESASDPATLWVPENAVSLEHSVYVKNNWPSQSRVNFYMAQPESGNNVLTVANIQAFFATHERVLKVTIDGELVVKDNPTLKEQYGGIWSFDGQGGTNRKKCYSFWGDACGVSSVLDIFKNDAAMIAGLDQASLLEKINAYDTAPSNKFIPALGVMKNSDIKRHLGGIKRDADNKIVSAEIMGSTWFLAIDNANVMMNGKMRNNDDPIAPRWEAEVVCLLGLEETNPQTDVDCKKPADGLKYGGYMMRSMSDSFGDTISKDIKNVGISYMLIIIYLFFNLGKRDGVHSMIAMSAACLGCVMFSFTGCNGLGGYFGVFKNPLLNNIPFLLLGLGVDDAFVLVSEFAHHTLLMPDASIEDRIAMTAKSGGLSVLITSVTDGLAFLIGSTTALPALSGFCTYAGMGVLLCFVFQIVFFLPLLALNARRTAANRLDCCCCITVEERSMQEPRGCCACIPCCPKIQPKDNLLGRSLEKMGQVTVKTKPGFVITISFFAILFIVGMSGLFQLEKDFQIEWFIAEGSYLNDVVELNKKYFSSGTQFKVYTKKVDMFDKQESMNQLSSYMSAQSFILDGTVQDWWRSSRAGSVAVSTDRAAFWDSMWLWYSSAEGTDYRSAIKWADARCNTAGSAECRPGDGIAHSATTATLEFFTNGVLRHKHLTKLREDLKKIFADPTGDSVFPFARDFMYWEEVGIIDSELAKNLVCCGGIIFAIICLLLPKPRIALLVSAIICASILEVVGFMHYWNVQINGVSTIYILICVGLAVDYSAHIAHVFNISTGSAEERALAALTRIGPSVFQAIFSTLLAVLVIGFSKSFIFQVFFKVLFLVTTIAGAHGIILLPVLLSVIGGDNLEDISKKEKYVEDPNVITVGAAMEAPKEEVMGA